MKLILLFAIVFTLSSCNEKKYEDYNEDDFIEVQGLITRIKKTANPIDSEWNKDITYAYNLDKEVINHGIERNVDLMFKIGQPIVILVHKEDEKISFYARRGLINEVVWKDGYINLIENKN